MIGLKVLILLLLHLHINSTEKSILYDAIYEIIQFAKDMEDEDFTATNCQDPAKSYQELMINGASLLKKSEEVLSLINWLKESFDEM